MREQIESVETMNLRILQNQLLTLPGSLQPGVNPPYRAGGTYPQNCMIGMPRGIKFQNCIFEEIP